MANMGSKNRVLYALIIGICIGLFSPSLLQTLIGDSQPTSYTNQDDARDQSLEAYARQRERIRRHANALDSSASKISTKQRKILLDCGANVASTIMMFRETYPGGEDFEIHSFEIDDRLAPYFAAHHGVNLHCPVGVSNKTGYMTAYSEAPWSPKKPLNNGKDMQWGGGTLFVSDDEKKDDATGGKRLLSHRKKIPVVDLSRWIQEHTSQEDYVIFKLDVEGAEFDILDKMIKDGTFKWIDKMYGEYHYSQPHGWDKKGRDRIKAAVKKQGHEEVDWAGEQRDYGDFDIIHPNHVTKYTPGEAGHVYSTCQPKTIAITVAVGMNFKRAQRLIDTITAYPAKVPVTLFFYGDFVQQYPDAVLRWSNKFDIGLREDSYYPPMNFELFAYNWIRAGLVSSEMKFRNLGIQPSFYLPLQLSVNVTANAKARGFRIIKPSAVFPPPLDYPVALFNRTAYYAVRDVERIPKALRVIYQQLEVNNGGILALDSDLPDSFMNIVFLFDYLVRASDFNLVNVDNCVRMNSS